MEENTIELFDYLRVIWKRKILIIALTLVGIVVGVVAIVVKNSGPKITPVTSHTAGIVIEIGKMLKISSLNTTLQPMEKPASLVEAIPIRYDEILSNFPEYHLVVSRIGQTNMIRLTMEGHDGGVEKVLKELVDMLIGEHYSLGKNTITAFKTIIVKLEEDAKALRENIKLIESAIQKIKNEEMQIAEYLHTGEGETDAGSGKYLGDRYVVWDMLYIKTINKTLELNKYQKNLRNIRWQLAAHRATLGNIDNYNTKPIGEMKIATVSKRQEKQYFIVKAGVTGLIMALLIAFFVEYIVESKSRRKGK